MKIKLTNLNSTSIRNVPYHSVVGIKGPRKLLIKKISEPLTITDFYQVVEIDPRNIAIPLLGRWNVLEKNKYISMYENIINPLSEKTNKEALERKIYLPVGIPMNDPQKRVILIAEKLKPYGYCLNNPDNFFHITAKNLGKPKTLIILERIALMYI